MTNARYRSCAAHAFDDGAAAGTGRAGRLADPAAAVTIGADIFASSRRSARRLVARTELCVGWRPACVMFWIVFDHNISPMFAGINAAQLDPCQGLKIEKARGLYRGPFASQRSLAPAQNRCEKMK
jgi:hypothetical protein